MPDIVFIGMEVGGGRGESKLLEPLKESLMALHRAPCLVLGRKEEFSDNLAHILGRGPPSLSHLQNLPLIIHPLAVLFSHTPLLLVPGKCHSIYFLSNFPYLFQVELTLTVA